MAKIKIDGWRCERCGHVWVAKKEQDPKVCPNPRCHSMYWNEPKPKGKRS